VEVREARLRVVEERVRRLVLEIVLAQKCAISLKSFLNFEDSVRTELRQ
jgi:hypothetical protein